jgi:hypothetical protein
MLQLGKAFGASTTNSQRILLAIKYGANVLLQAWVVFDQ